MRPREDILKDATRKEDLIIEVLLDIRDLLVKAIKGGRPKKIRKKRTNSLA